MDKKVLIQGIEGSNHHLAVTHYFGHDASIIEPCESFDQLFSKLGRTSDGLAMVAIENSLVGSILPNYIHLLHSGMHILGEYSMRISHHLMAMPGQKLHELREVYSHPMALAQCEQFLSQQPHLRQVAADDTADAARLISTAGIKGRAAIAPLLAASLYGLEVVVSHIESNAENFTRFLLIGRNHPCQPGLEPDKSTVAFSLPHKKGSLARVLAFLAENDINLTKIQSLPMAGTAWEYLFFAEMIFDDPQQFELAMQAIRPHCNRLEMLGTYVSSENFQKQSKLTSFTPYTHAH
ncbi:MAG: prephenate dehydratase [Bacteroidetes bacterium]|nr:prephenate dehydratase [Bacteroidota bacterium]